MSPQPYFQVMLQHHYTISSTELLRDLFFGKKIKMVKLVGLKCLKTSHAKGLGGMAQH